MDPECVDPISTGTRLNGHIFQGKQSYQIWREAGSFLNKHSQQVPSATQYTSSLRFGLEGSKWISGSLQKKLYTTREYDVFNNQRQKER